MCACAGTREGQQLTQSSIRTFVREGTEVYMDKLEGTNSWADMLDAMGRPGNGAVADRMTRVFVREMITAYFRRSSPDSGSRWGLVSHGALPNTCDSVLIQLLLGVDCITARVLQ